MSTKRTYEAPEMGAFIARTLRAMARRAAEGDEAALAELAKLQGTLDTAIADAARGLHDFGQSWTYIGGELGITRQAAQQRFGRTKGPKLAPVDELQTTIDDQLLTHADKLNDRVMNGAAQRMAILRGEL